MNNRYFAEVYNYKNETVFIPTIREFADFKKVENETMTRLGYEVEDDVVYAMPWSEGDEVTYLGFVNNNDFVSECIKLYKTDEGYVVDITDQEKRSKQRAEFGGLEAI